MNASTSGTRQLMSYNPAIGRNRWFKMYDLAEQLQHYNVTSDKV